MITDEMAKQAYRVYCQYESSDDTEAMRAALLAVAPMIRAAALEEAAKWHDEQHRRAIADWDKQKEHRDMMRLGTHPLDRAHEHTASAAAIRALAERDAG